VRVGELLLTLILVELEREVGVAQRGHEHIVAAARFARPWTLIAATRRASPRAGVDGRRARPYRSLCAFAEGASRR
jgi:hypothetical protein